MKKILIITFIFMIAGAVFADVQPTKKYNNAPQGTFKKNRNGDFVQYDKNGKKNGVYKISKGKYYRVK